MDLLDLFSATHLVTTTVADDAQSYAFTERVAGVPDDELVAALLAETRRAFAALHGTAPDSSEISIEPLTASEQRQERASIAAELHAMLFEED